MTAHCSPRPQLNKLLNPSHRETGENCHYLKSSINQMGRRNIFHCKSSEARHAGVDDRLLLSVAIPAVHCVQNENMSRHFCGLFSFSHSLSQQIDRDKMIPDFGIYPIHFFAAERKKDSKKDSKQVLALGVLFNPIEKNR